MTVSPLILPKPVGQGALTLIKRDKGRKRHITTDTNGLLLSDEVREASIQDRDGAVELLVKLRIEHPSVETVLADGGYAGKKL